MAEQSAGPMADEVLARENIRDEMGSIHSMNQSFVNQIFTVMRRGSINRNLRVEMLAKLDWMASRIRELPGE